LVFSFVSSLIPSLLSLSFFLSPTSKYTQSLFVLSGDSPEETNYYYIFLIIINNNNFF